MSDIGGVSGGLNGPIRLKEKRSVYLEKWTWERESFKKIAQKIAKKLRSYATDFKSTIQTAR